MLNVASASEAIATQRSTNRVLLLLLLLLLLNHRVHYLSLLVPCIKNPKWLPGDHFLSRMNPVIVLIVCISVVHNGRFRENHLKTFQLVLFMNWSSNGLTIGVNITSLTQVISVLQYRTICAVCIELSKLFWYGKKHGHVIISLQV